MPWGMPCSEDLPKCAALPAAADVHDLGTGVLEGTVKSELQVGLGFGCRPRLCQRGGPQGIGATG